MALNFTSTPTNPLTAPLPPDLNLAPAQRAVDRFAITGNAIVTGGAGGLGFEATRALLEHGAKGVCIFDLAPAFVSERAKLQTLYDEFPDCKILEDIVDVADEASVQAAVARAAAGLGSVDILLCFAGIAHGQPAIDMEFDQWNKVLAINLTGSMLCSKYAAKEMVRQNSGGSIILVSSAAGHKSLFPLVASAYSTSKFAVRGLTVNLAGEWAQYGIRVNCLCPGYMTTNMTASPQTLVGIQAYTERTPLGRPGHASEVSGPIVMFCSAAGRFITGIDILINGGNHVY